MIGFLGDLMTGFLDFLPYVFSVEFAYRFESNLILIFVAPFKLAIVWLIMLVRKNKQSIPQKNYTRMFFVLYIQRNPVKFQERKIHPLSIKLIRIFG